MTSKRTVLSIIITAHSESTLIHRTLSSVWRAARQLPPDTGTETILHIDNPTDATTAYIDAHKSTTLKDVRIFMNSFGDLGSSRNFAIQQATGKYIATIDADDLMSKEWLSRAITALEEATETTIAHSEYTIEFEGADSLIIKHGEIDYDTDTLLSVYANRWNSVIVAPRKLLLEYPYTPNSPGYGYEDWNLNSRLIHAKVHNILIPDTAIFVRRKHTNSEWARQIQSMAVLRANPLLSFDNIRAVANPFHSVTIPTVTPASNRHRALDITKRIVKRHPATHRIARYVKQSVKRRPVTLSPQDARVPKWLQAEWRELHEVDRQIFPTRHLMQTIPIYDTLTEDHKLAGSLYKTLVDQLRFNKYEYLIFAPWLTKGGADKYTIEYANTIAELTHKHVLVAATLPHESPWRNKLSDAVDFLDFGTITQHASQEIRQRLMEHIIENADVHVLHIINSEFGYDFVQLHEKYINASDKKVVVTSFSQSVEPDTGRLYGYSHTHVPFVYDIADIITSDNQAVLNMWVREYGFDPKKLYVHRQPIDLAEITNIKTNHTIHSPLRILWAGRIASEKLPEVAVAIGSKLENKIIIDMYGAQEAGFESLLSNLPANVSYKGSYSGFDSLPINNYDILLYTSLFDGMPNVILEAASTKLPIIASSVGGIPEFISDHVNGTLIKDIYNPIAYTEAIEDFIINIRSEAYAEKAYSTIKLEYSREQYISSVKHMLTRLEIL